MGNKHYDVNYLEDTFRLLNNLKQLSYKSFESLKSGKVVDLGCGAGTDVIELAKRLSSDIKVIGVDHDPVMVQEGKNSANINNVDFVLSEAYPLPFEDNSIDGLRSERMIQHLTNADLVFTDIARILKPGSPVVIIETDWHSLSFYTQHIETQKNINAYLTDIKVNNGFAARKLCFYLSSSGISNLQFSIHPLVIDSLDVANAIFFVDKIVDEAAQQNYISSQQQAEFLETLQQSGRLGYFSCSINLVMVTGNKN